MKTQSRGSSKKPSMLETKTAKTSSAERSRSSDSNSRRPMVKEEALTPVVGRTWLTKSKFL